MRNKFVIALLSLTAISTLSSCGKSAGELEINFTDAVPAAYVDEEYDVADILIMDEGVNYTLEAYYQNYYENKEYSIPTNGLKFTQTENFNVSIVVNAKKGKQTAKKSKLIQVDVKGDPIDELMRSDGLSGYADAGYTKELTTDEQYCKDGGASALACYYQGNNYYTWGAAILCPENFRLLDYWTDKTWENTVLRFWCYNPTEYDIEFQLRIFDKYTGLVNIDWGQSMNIVQKAAPGEWTECLFPLHRVGIDHTLFVNEEGTRNDNLTVKIRWAGAPEEEPTPLYSFQFYIDGLDMVPASQYPDLDTNCYAKAEYASDSLENVMLDDGWSGSFIKYDREVVRNTDNTGDFKSKSSLWAIFNGAPRKDNGYSVIFNFGSAVQDADIEDAPNLSHGILKADIKFEGNITNYNIGLVVTQDWTSIVKSEFPTTDLGDGWRRLEIDMALYEEYAFFVEPIRIGFSFIGVTDANKSTAQIHIDNFHYLQEEGTPSEERPDLETWQDGLENLAIDSGWNGSVVKHDYKVVCGRNAFSTYSTKLTFDANIVNNNYGYGITLSPEMEPSYRPLPSAVGNTLEMDIKFEGVDSKQVRLGFVRQIPDNWDTKDYTVELSEATLENGWYHLSYDMDANTELQDFTQIIRICIYFPGVYDENFETATVWLDNIFIEAK